MLQIKKQKLKVSKELIRNVNYPLIFIIIFLVNKQSKAKVKKSKVKKTN